MNENFLKSSDSKKPFISVQSSTRPSFNGIDQYNYILYDEGSLNYDKHEHIFLEEVISYLKYIRTLSISSINFDFGSKSLDELTPMKFWSVCHKKWPCLGRLAKKIFSVPSEAFGTEHSLQLNSQQSLPANKEKIIFLKCNQNLN